MITDGQRIALVDTGIGRHDIADPFTRIGLDAIVAAGFQFLPAVTAASQIEMFGFNLEAVTDIVLTRGDPDHVGRLADFPHAAVHISAEELTNMQSRNPRYSVSQFSHGPKWEVYSNDDSTVFDLKSRSVQTSLDIDIRLVPLFGHTHGHCGVAVLIDDSWTLHAGDAYYLRAELTDENHPINELATIRADNDELRRRSLMALRALNRREVRLFGYHDTSELPPEATHESAARTCHPPR